MPQAQRVPECSTARTYQRGFRWYFDVQQTYLMNLLRLPVGPKPNLSNLD